MTGQDESSTAKAALRRSIRAARSGRDGRADDLAAVALAHPVVAALGPGDVVTAYAALPGEPDPGVLRQRLREVGVRVLLPVVGRAEDGSPGLVWADDDGPLEPGAATPTGLRIAEPTGPKRTDPGPLAVVFMPATAVSRQGHRLGQGAGYYDRTAAHLGWGPRPPAGPLLVAVLHADEVRDVVPHNDHDVIAHAVLSADGWIDLG